MRALLVCLLVVGAASANEDPDTEVARRHFNLGRAHYDSSDYKQALDEFEQARRVRPHPALDFNIARCLDRLERWPEAVRFYESYAASNPADGAQVRVRIEQLKERIREPPTAPTAPIGPEPIKELLLAPPPSLLETAAPPPRKSRRTVAIVLGVLGGAAVIGAAVAIGLLVKTTTDPAWPDSTGGPHPATR